MPEQKLKEAPRHLREQLPEQAQRIYVEAYNRAYEEYADPGRRRSSESRETAAHRVAWATVEKSFLRGNDGKWRPRNK